MSSRTLLLLAPGLALANVVVPPNRVFAVSLSPCTTAQAIAVSCYSAIPNFSAAPVTEIAACLCCSGGSWSPDSFDSPVSSCAEELQSEYPTETSLISDFVGLEGFCSMAGSVHCGGAITGTITGTITSSPTTAVSASAGVITGSAGCDSAVAIIESCSLSMTNPAFDQASEDQLAACLCYDGGRWEPDVFDGYMGSCASWARTADTARYMSVTALTTFCEDVGDITTTTSAGLISKTANPTTTQSSGGGIVGGLTSFTRTTTASTGHTATSASNSGTSNSGANNSGASSLVARSGIGGIVAVALGLYLML